MRGLHARGVGKSLGCTVNTGLRVNQILVYCLVQCKGLQEQSARSYQ